MFHLLSSYEPKKKPATCEYSEHCKQNKTQCIPTYDKILLLILFYRKRLLYNYVRDYLMYVIYVNLSLYILYIQ